MLKMNVVMWYTNFIVYVVLEICPEDPYDKKTGKPHWGNLNVNLNYEDFLVLKRKNLAFDKVWTTEALLLISMFMPSANH